jgi:hypothetical protein
MGTGEWRREGGGSLESASPGEVGRVVDSGVLASIAEVWGECSDDVRADRRRFAQEGVPRSARSITVAIPVSMSLDALGWKWGRLDGSGPIGRS